MTFVIYDNSSGTIAQTMQCSELSAKNTAAAMEMDYLEVPSSLDDLHPDDYSSMAVVSDGQLVKKGA